MLFFPLHEPYLFWDEDIFTQEYSKPHLSATFAVISARIVFACFLYHFVICSIGSASLEMKSVFPSKDVFLADVIFSLTYSPKYGISSPSSPFISGCRSAIACLLLTWLIIHSLFFSTKAAICFFEARSDARTFTRPFSSTIIDMVFLRE